MGVFGSEKWNLNSASLLAALLFVASCGCSATVFYRQEIRRIDLVVALFPPALSGLFSLPLGFWLSVGGVIEGNGL